MRLLTFTVGAESYGVPSRLVVEVLPLVPARPIPHSPPFLRGVFSYRGSLVPLVDLGLLFLGRPLQERLSTRVIVVEAAAATRRLGIVAENVVSFATIDDAAAAPAWHAPQAPYLGRVLRIDGRTVQLIEPQHLLPVPPADSLPADSLPEGEPPADASRDALPPSPLSEPS